MGIVDVRITAVASVIGLQRNFTAAFRQIDGEGRHRERREARSEFPENFQSAFDAGRVMAHSAYRIDVKEVVRLDADCDKFAEQFFQNVGVVVDSLEQNALIDDRHSGSDQPGTGRGGFPGDFTGRIEVCGEPEAGNFPEFLREFRSDPLRPDDGNPTAETENFQRWNRAQVIENLKKPREGEHDRVAAGEKNFMNFRVFSQMACRVIQFTVGNVRQVGAVRPFAFAETEAAAHCAARG